jgi:Sec-independent protein translocase protein TatA
VFSGLTPQYWHFWIGLALVVLVLVGRDRISALARDAAAAFSHLRGSRAARGAAVRSPPT